MTRRLTQILVLAALAALIVYNVVIVIEPTPNDSITSVVREWMGAHFAVPLAVGVILGHLAWPARKYVPEIGPYVLAVWGVVAALIDWSGWLPDLPPLPILLFGVVLGGWLWGPTHRELKGK